MSWTAAVRKFLLGASVFWSCVVFCTAHAADDDDDTGSGNGPGYNFRVGGSFGQGVPQDRSVYPIEAFPFILEDDSLFFSDLRFFPALNNWSRPANTTFGGNVGLGYRYYSDSYDRVFGGSIWYDADDTRLLYFQQLGLSLETYGEYVDFRTNFYLPVGPVSQQSSVTLVNGSTQFVGDNLSYNQYRTWSVAMKGFDAEAGLSVPWDWARDMALRVYAGGYYFVDNQSDSITGVSGRITANIISGLDAQVQVTYDNFYQTRAFIGLSWTFGPLHFSKLKQDTAFGRIGDHVTRNYTVVAPERSRVEYVGAAINPATGKPYSFAHVVSGAPAGGNGTVNNPFATIAAAQAANRSIIFVHAGSAFNGSDASIVLNPGNRIIGDGAGVQNLIQVPELGSILLPQASPSSHLPMLIGAAGDSVVLASNSIFSGFSIKNSGGSGILGNGVQNVTLSNININNAGLDGIRLVNSSGQISIAGPTITNPFGSGINIIGGSGSIAFSGTTTVRGAGAPSVDITGLPSGGSVTFADLTINSRKDMGLSINSSSAGTVTVTGTTTITNENAATASAIDIRDSSGSFSFNTVNITGATGSNAAVNLQNDSSATTLFQTVNISTNNATALRAISAGTLSINPAINNNVDLNHGGTINAVGGTAVDIQNTALNVNLLSVSSSNAPSGSYGINLVNTSGLFVVFGNGTAGSGGVIQGASSGGIFLQNTGLTGLQWMTINNNLFGIHADTVSSLHLSSSTVSNSATYGIYALNTPAMTIDNDIFTGNGSANISANFNVSGGSYGYSITNSQFTSTTADNVDLTGSGSTLNFSMQNNLYANSAAGTAGINLNWNGALTGQFNQSSFVETGNSITGLAINNTSSALSSVAFNNNLYSTTGTFGTAFHFTGLGTSVFTATNNMIQFGGTNGTGFEMSLVGPNVSIANNKFTDATDGATGLLFDSVTGPGVIAINNNSFSFANTGALLDRGIIFSSVPTTFQLQGTVSNTITGADTPFFAPANSTTGSILVNGAVKP
jgi:hypothetical protein